MAGADTAKKGKAGKLVKRRAVPSAGGNRWWSAAFGLLLALIVWTGLAVVDDARVTRSLYQALSETQHEQDRLLEQHSRLSLELGALSSLAKVEEVATTQLNMTFPQRIEEVAP